uniref:Autophagy-related protein 9 n=1 Tax=Alexandrium andersonii TaxID=327968 RepID=A0A7S2FQB5_9DINO
MFRFDGQMLISLMFSFVVFAKGLQDAWCQINDVIQFEKKVPKGIECIKDAERRLHNTKIMFLVILSLVAVALGHCMLKFAMAFVCEDSMWDLHVPFWHKEGVNQMGCVDLGRIMREFTHFNATMRP